MNDKQKLKIGTRGSDLALAQTELVIDALQKKYPQLEIEKIIIRTKGDKILNQPLINFGGKGVFVTEFEDALRSGKIDLAIHSSKDMPMELGENLEISGVLQREDARDVLVTLQGTDISKMDQVVIGTGSLRRQHQVCKVYEQVNCKNIRGNVPTRLKKLLDKECDGVVLAAAGLKRLGLLDDPSYTFRFFDYDEMIPAGGQGIIAIEGRRNDAKSEMVKAISDETAYLELELERRILKSLGAGCHEAVGTVSQIQNGQVNIWIFWEQNGKIFRTKGTASMEQRDSLEEELVRQIKAGETVWEKYT